MSRLGQTSLEPLEPYDGKLSCTVLRGESPERGLTYSICYLTVESCIPLQLWI